MFDKLIVSGINDTIKESGDAVDKIVTSDEERLAMRNELVNIKSKVQEKQMELAHKMQEMITERWVSDNNSDSWLAKNIRPTILVFMAVATVGLAYASIFLPLTVVQVTALEAWMPVFLGIDSVVFGAYFGGRSFEKGKKFVRDLKISKEAKMTDEAEKLFGAFRK